MHFCSFRFFVAKKNWEMKKTNPEIYFSVDSKKRIFISSSSCYRHPRWFGHWQTCKNVLEWTEFEEFFFFFFFLSPFTKVANCVHCVCAWVCVCLGLFRSIRSCWLCRRIDIYLFFKSESFLRTNALTPHHLECFQCEFIDVIKIKWHKTPNNAIECTLINIPMVVVRIFFISVNVSNTWRENISFLLYFFCPKEYNLRHRCYSLSLVQMWPQQTKFHCVLSAHMFENDLPANANGEVEDAGHKCYCVILWMIQELQHKFVCTQIIRIWTM